MKFSYSVVLAGANGAQIIPAPRLLSRKRVFFFVISIFQLILFFLPLLKMNLMYNFFITVLVLLILSYPKKLIFTFFNYTKVAK